MGIAVLGIVAHPTSRDRIFAAAVLGAIVAWSAASVGLHLSYFRTFGLVLALVPAVAPEWPIPKTAIRTLLRAIVIRSAAVPCGRLRHVACIERYQRDSSHREPTGDSDAGG